VADAADEREVAQDSAGRRVGAVAAQLELAAALGAGRGARLDLGDGGRVDVDGAVGRGAGELARQALHVADVLAERALLFATLLARARRAHTRPTRMPTGHVTTRRSAPPHAASILGTMTFMGSSPACLRR